MKKRLLTTILTILVFMVATFGTACADTKLMSFSDINDKYWAKPNIDTLVARGGISGYPDGTFKPSNSITAAEFVKIALYLLDDIKVDTEGYTGADWYKPYAEKAVEVGIVPEDMFDNTTWKKAIPRQKMAVISIKVATTRGEDMTVENKDVYAKKFSDYDSICKYCKDYVLNAVGKGIVAGYPGGTFKPESGATRAEAAAMLVRVIDPTQRLAVGTTEDLTGCAETITYSIGEYRYTIPCVEHTAAEMGIVKITKEGKYVRVYTTSPTFSVTMRYIDQNKDLAQCPTLNVGTNLDYEKEGSYYVYDFKDVAGWLTSGNVYFVAERKYTINGIYFPEKTAVRITDIETVIK
ncbi:MAG: S-layer homology domain-containing protein [Firmicutes bacterium]|nr:S-layer homology domain-containing protein [Bacillota bacterium]